MLLFEVQFQVHARANVLQRADCEALNVLWMLGRWHSWLRSFANSDSGECGACSDQAQCLVQRIFKAPHSGCCACRCRSGSSGGCNAGLGFLFAFVGLKMENTWRKRRARTCPIFYCTWCVCVCCAFAFAALSCTIRDYQRVFCCDTSVQ
jgi:hypothetical protein